MPDGVPTCGDFFGGGDDDIFADRQAVEGAHNFHGGAAFVFNARQYDEQIKVAIGCGLAVGVGTEQDDILRAKRVNDLLSDLAQESWSDWRRCRFSIVSRFDALGICFEHLQIISLSRI